VFRRANDQYGGLSNMTAQFPVCVGELRAWSSEALYQACRFPHDPDVQSEVLAERSPMTAKMKSKKYRDRSRDDWDRVRVSVMRWCLRVKLVNNWDSFGSLLLATGEHPIVEESTKDDFWGAEPQADGVLSGRNVLGRLLMELRQQLRESPESVRIVDPPAISDFKLLGRSVGRIGLPDGSCAKSDGQPSKSALSHQKAAEGRSR
jgi:ribA/ribD-fused uncharacterized protein